MENKFIAKASVCMPDEDATLGILWTLERIGYKPSGVGLIGRDKNISIYMGLYQGLIFPDSSVKNINCNDYTDSEEDAIELFLILASLTNDIETTPYLKCIRSVAPYYWWGDIVKSQDVEVLGNFEVAKPIDVAFAFKKKEIIPQSILAENWKQINSNTK